MRALTAVLVVGFLAGLCSAAVATEIVAEAWRAQYLSACSELQLAADDCTLCHPGGDTGQLNPYSGDIQTARQGTATWSLAIIQIDGDDSDGDGVENGVEIDTDCTFPGDPDSVPTKEKTWGQIKELYDR